LEEGREVGVDVIGMDVGVELGVADGVAVGLEEGREVGVDVVGMDVGVELGGKDGVPVGRDEGVRVVGRDDVGLDVGLRVVGLLVGLRVVVGFRVVGFLVGERVVPWRFRDTFIVLASSSPLFSASPPVRKARSLVSVFEVAYTHPFCGCQVHPPVPVRHEIFSVKDVQPLTV
jgi:hypothetical protein